MSSLSTLSICCAVPTGIPSVVTSVTPCAADVGQIQKAIFWRTGNTLSVASAITSTGWTTLLAATGDTKAIVTPFLAAVELPPGDPREFGGGNETRWGASHRKGGTSPVFSAVMYNEDQDVITALKNLRCEHLDVIFINEANQFIYSDAASALDGFQVVPGSFFVSDKGIGGLEEDDRNTIMFNLKPNWSDSLEISAETTFALDMVNS